jgi:prefoldin subunit 5
VPSLRGLKARLRGDQLNALAAEVAATREVVLQINHAVAEMQAVLLELNHDVRSGAERSLPLFLGYTERLRLDADTAVGATQVIERQLALLDERLATLDAAQASPDPR